MSSANLSRRAFVAMVSGHACAACLPKPGAAQDHRRELRAAWVERARRRTTSTRGLCLANAETIGDVDRDTGLPGLAATLSGATAAGEPIFEGATDEIFIDANGRRIRAHYSLTHPIHALPTGLRDPPAAREKAFLDARRGAFGEFFSNSPAPRQVQFGVLAAFDAWRRLEDLGFCDGPLFASPTDQTIDLWFMYLYSYRGGTGPARDLIAVERSLHKDQLYLTVGHEMFHRFQYRYNSSRLNSSVNPDILATCNETELAEHDIAYSLIREGGARFAEDLLLDHSDRYITTGRQWFYLPRLSLVRWEEADGRVDDAGYQASLFWKYVAEQNGAWVPGGPDGARRGADVQKAVLEATRETGPAGTQGCSPLTLSRMAEAWRTMSGIGAFDAIAYLDATRREVVCQDTSWGNFVVALVLNGTAGPDNRFGFAESRFWRGVDPALRQQPRPAFSRYSSAPVSATARYEPGHVFEYDDLPPLGGAAGAEIEVTSVPSPIWGLLDTPADSATPQDPGAAGADPRPASLPPYSVVHYAMRMPVDGRTRLVRIRFKPLRGLGDALVQFVLLDRGGALVDLIRHDHAAHPDGEARYVLAFREEATLVAIIASRRQPGDFTLGLSRAEDQPVVMAASWNAQSSRYMTDDPAKAIWTWQSPDIAVTPVPAPSQHSHFLALSLRNRGRKTAEGVSVSFYARHRNGGDWEVLALDPRDLPVTIPTEEACLQSGFRPSGTPGQPPGCKPRPANETRTVRALWPADRALTDYIIRATISVEDDPGHLGKVILTAFGGDPPRLAADHWPGRLAPSATATSTTSCR